MILSALVTDAGTFTARTGWKSKPEGFCLGDMCVPAPQAKLADGRLDVTVLADKLGLVRLPPQSARVAGAS